MTNIKSSDPRIHLENVKVEEQAILKKLKNKEAEIRILLAQIKALRNLKEQAIKLLDEKDEYELEEKELLKKESIDSIDELVDDVQTIRKEGKEEDKPYQTSTVQEPLYNIPKGEEVQLATDENTISELYSLAKKTTHTPQEQKRFFDITSAVIKSKPYEMSPIIQEKVNNTYQAIKTIIGENPNLAQSYKPIENTSKVQEFLSAIKKVPSVNYKSK